MNDSKQSKSEEKDPALKSSESTAEKSASAGEEKPEDVNEKKEKTESDSEAKISQVAGKTSEMAGDVLDVLKKGLSQAYEAGVKVVDEITQTAHEYAEKYKHNMEVKNLTKKRDKFSAELGLITFNKYSKLNMAFERILEEKEVVGLIEEIEKIEREIVKVGKELEKS
jgi:hypothetical protein